jgi:hypothetical protein
MAKISKPFWRPKDLTHFSQACVDKRPKYFNIPVACRLALSKMAANLECISNQSGP